MTVNWCLGAGYKLMQRLQYPLVCLILSITSYSEAPLPTDGSHLVDYKLLRGSAALRWVSYCQFQATQRLRCPQVGLILSITSNSEAQLPSGRSHIVNYKLLRGSTALMWVSYCQLKATQRLHCPLVGLILSITSYSL